jgi:hypothetical protein
MLASANVSALETALENPGPLAKPDTSAAVPPGDTDPVAVAMAFPLKNGKADVKPEKEEMPVPGGIGPGVETETSTKVL